MAATRSINVVMTESLAARPFATTWFPTSSWSQASTLRWSMAHKQFLESIVEIIQTQAINKLSSQINSPEIIKIKITLLSWVDSKNKILLPVNPLPKPKLVFFYVWMQWFSCMCCSLSLWVPMLSTFMYREPVPWISPRCMQVTSPHGCLKVNGAD